MQRSLDNLLTGSAETTAAAVTGALQAKKISDKITRISHFASGGYISDVAQQIPGVALVTGAAGSMAAVPSEMLIQFLLNGFLSWQLHSCVKQAAKKAEESSLARGALNSALELAGNVITPSYKDSPCFLLAKTLGKGIAFWGAQKIKQSVIDTVTAELHKILAPIVCQPSAKTLGQYAGDLVKESLKTYFGYFVQSYILTALAKQYEDEKYGTLKTSLQFAKRLGDSDVFWMLVMTMITAQLLPMLQKMLLGYPAKERLKMDLTDYIVNKIKQKDALSNLFVTISVELTVDKLLKSGISCYQLRTGLDAVKLAERTNLIPSL